MKIIICLIKGHIPTKWIWAELDYACTNCKRCKKVIWGCTEAYGNTFGQNKPFSGKYCILERGKTK